MKTAILGLAQAGKTSLFQILTHAQTTIADKRDTHVGVVKVPDDRLDRLALLYNPKKITHTSIDYLDTTPFSTEALKEGAYSVTLRQVDGVACVIRAFEDVSVPLLQPIDPVRDIRQMEVEFILNDLAQVEKRLERLEKEKRAKQSSDTQREYDLLKRAQTHLESEHPLRDLQLAQEEKKKLRGFTFLSEKPILYVLNVGEKEASTLDQTVQRYGLEKIACSSGVGVTAICGKIEAELATLKDEDAQEFLAGYGLKESGLIRLIRKTYELMGLISFFTVGEDECRAWAIPGGSHAVEAAGAIHSDLAKHFIRAEVIRWHELLEFGSEANARQKGKLRLEGKDYLVQDGDVVHIRHSG